MILLYYIIVNDFKYLQGDVTVRAKSLFLLYKMIYTVYTVGYTVVLNLKGLSDEVDSEDEDLGLTF